MTKNHGKTIKDDKKYEALRDEGMSKEKAARIANAPNASKKGGKASPLCDRTQTQLLEEAKKSGIKVWLKMNKSEQFGAIRNQ